MERRNFFITAVLVLFPFLTSKKCEAQKMKLEGREKFIKDYGIELYNELTGTGFGS